MPARDPNKPDGYYCDAERKGKSPCSMRAGQGTDHVGIGRCSRHLGSTRNHKRAAQREQARQACELFSLTLEHRDPADVLYDELDRARGATRWFEREIALAMEAGDDELLSRRWAGWQTERKLATSVSLEIQRLGLAVRHVEMQENIARQVAAVLARHAELLGHDPSSREARAASRQALQLVSGEGE